MEIEFPHHYENGKVENYEQVRQALNDTWNDEDPGVDELNWLFVGTSGIHGSYTKIDEWPEKEDFTVLIVRPRMVSCLYGNIEIENEEQYQWLREQVVETSKIIEDIYTP